MIQSIINLVYRYPKSQWRTYQKFGGYFEYQKMLFAEKRMQKVAKNLLVNAPNTNLQTLNVCFLTGKKYWYQTIFCVYSLQKVCPYPVHFTFYDDGSFNSELIKKYKEQIPYSTFVTFQEIEERLYFAIPPDKFPYLHHKRQIYKHIRKLTDIHAGNNGWKLMLDSDMLFWKEPKQMIDWLLNPHQPFYILDIGNAYGYPISELEKLANSNIPEKMNVGMIGLKSESIDFEKLEYWAKYLESNFGNSYYLEQALSAMIVGDKPSIVGKKEDYIVFPSREQIQNQAGVLHHYVDVSKKWYFQEAWKQIL